MRNEYEDTWNSKYSCEKGHKSNSNYDYGDSKKYEAFGSESKYLYNKALSYREKIEKYTNMALEAEIKAKKLEEEAKMAWFEYNEFIEKASIATMEGEELIKASCRLLEEYKGCFKNSYFDYSK